MREKNWVARAYERFLELPVAVVLAVLWLGGMVLLGSCVLTLYLYGRALVQMVLG
jgi:hypothetical protein